MSFKQVFTEILGKWHYFRYTSRTCTAYYPPLSYTKDNEFKMCILFYRYMHVLKIFKFYWTFSLSKSISFIFSKFTIEIRLIIAGSLLFWYVNKIFNKKLKKKKYDWKYYLNVFTLFANLSPLKHIRYFLMICFRCIYFHGH